jgi:hypothetical protein
VVSLSLRSLRSPRLGLFIRSTILGGVIFLAPIVVLIVILAKAFGYAKTGIHAVVVRVPGVSDLSVGVATVLSITMIASSAFSPGSSLRP